MREIKEIASELRDVALLRVTRAIAEGLLWLDSGGLRVFASAMFREVLKSKLHRAMITDANVDYAGSIEIPSDLMGAADLWAGEKVLVASITTGARLETYVLEGQPGTGKILINGGAAHLIKAGERVAVMAFALSETPMQPKILLFDENNQVIDGASNPC
jgi:aspartate 1-decarboxylase